MAGSDRMSCRFCDEAVLARDTRLANEHCRFLRTSDPVLVGAGIIVPRAHRETVFDLTEEEWAATYRLLQEVKRLLDGEHHPHGYNVGWNCGGVAGQKVFHAHLHVIPRFADEPLAGKGIRDWIKEPINMRPAETTDPDLKPR